ncbi:MAG: hypothetical protein U0J70_07775, partial [Atopobiaceae bacterium]|nr:hypothetical protein [Atopobiaceae bacterium]
RIRELDKLNVRAILFEDGQYESVRVILEQLIREMHPNEFQTLTHKASALSATAYFNPYVYDSGLTPLFGRSDELDELTRFVTSTHDDFRWWALTGPGGSGKSRLAFELQNMIDEMPKWHAHKLTSDDYKDLQAYFSKLPSTNMLVIADYVQAHARELGERMQSLVECSPTSRIRLLLVEREGTSLGNSETQSSWQSQLFENVHHVDKVMAACWDKHFLTLQPLQPNDLLSIIDSFAEALIRRGIAKRQAPTEEERQRLIERLNTIDEGLCRPLYALFITGALMDNSDPSHWDKEKVLDYITRRETERIDARIRHVEGKRTQDRSALRSVLHLYRLATVFQGGEFELIRTLCTDEWSKLERAATSIGLDGTEELLDHIGLTKNGTVKPMEPDLMGEYFVFDWLCKTKPEKRDAFIARAWTQEISTVIFFDRLFTDYAHLLNEEPNRWLWFLPPSDSDSTLVLPFLAWIRATLLTNMSAICSDSKTCTEIVGRIEALLADFPGDREVALELAKGLFNLSCKQDADAAA